MDCAVSTLKDVVKRLNGVQSEHYIFDAGAAYSIGQNLTIKVNSPDLGRFCVNADKFRAVIARFDRDVNITFQNGLNQEEPNEALRSKIVLKAKRSKVSLPLLAIVEIPKVILPNIQAIQVPLKEFMAGLQYAGQCCEAGLTFNYSGAVSLSASGQEITAAGTDGKRIAFCSLKAAAQFHIIVPFPAIATLKVLEGSTISVSESNENLYFQDGVSTIVARKLAKSFPSYIELIPKSFKTKAVVSVQEIKNALRQIAPLVEEKIYLTLSDSECSLSVQGNQGEASCAIGASNFQDDPFSEPLGLRFLVRYDHINDYVEQVSGDIIICANDEGTPIFLECGEKKLLCISSKT